MAVTAFVPERVVAIEVTKPDQVVLQVGADGSYVVEHEFLECRDSIVMFTIVVDVEDCTVPL